MEKANIVLIHKEGDKQCLKNYRPFSLLPVGGKILERLIFNEMFRFFIANNLISSNQSGFKPGDACINQLLSITHEICKSFDNGFKLRGVFLDITKAFDKVWREGIIFKLKQNGISGKLLSVLSDFLKDRKQRVTLNGQVYLWTGVNAGVPQVSILGHLLFLVYINDLADSLSSNVKLFADDITIFSVIHNLKVITTKVNVTIGLIRKLQNILLRPALMTIFKAFVRPHLQYGDVIYDEAYRETFHQKLESIQYNACLALSGAIRGSSREKRYQELGF